MKSRWGTAGLRARARPPVGARPDCCDRWIPRLRRLVRAGNLLAAASLQRRPDALATERLKRPGRPSPDVGFDLHRAVAIDGAHWHVFAMAPRAGAAPAAPLSGSSTALRRHFAPTTSSVALVTPDRSMPSLRAAAWETSPTRSGVLGLRSLTRTTTLRWLAVLVTFTRLPKGSACGPSSGQQG